MSPAESLTERTLPGDGEAVRSHDDDASIVNPRLVQREMRDFQRAHERRRRQLPRSLLVGLLAGLMAVAFRSALAGADDLRNWLLVYVHTQPFSTFPLPALLAAVAAGTAV